MSEENFNFDDCLDYAKNQIQRLGGKAISIPGNIPDSFFARFEGHGIKVSREPLGYLRFEKIERKSSMEED